MLKPLFLAALILSTQLVQADCECGPEHMRASVRHIEAGGIGYNKGYTTLEAFFAADPNTSNVMPFADVRAHVFNDGKFAFNGGFGGRTIWGCRAYGLNGYIDYRKTHHTSYAQWGVGLETLGDLWDFRVNGYIPFGRNASDPYDVQFSEFSGHTIYVKRKFEYAMRGIDAEAGFHFGQTSNFDFYAAAGPYYFKGKMGDGALGGKVRLTGYYKEYVTLELSDSYDTVFHNNVQGQLTLTLPFGPKSRARKTQNCCPDTCEFANSLARRMVQPVAREEIIVVDTHTKKEATDDFVVFVDNLSHSAGTFESPYPTLLDAQENSAPGDIIYVFPGNGTTDGMNDGIILQNQQKLWGSGVAHTLATNLGTILIPPLTADAPQISNMSGSTVSLALNNEVSGFTINAPGGDGIYGDEPGSASILSCDIITVDNIGIELYFNSRNGRAIIDQVFIDDTNEGAVYMETGSDNHVDISITNSIFNNNHRQSIDIESYNTSKAAISIANCQFLSTYDEASFFLADHFSQVNVSINDSTFTGTTYPVDAEVIDTAFMNFSLANCTITDSTDYIYLSSNSNSETPSTFLLSNNSITGGSIYPFYGDFASSNPVEFTATGNNCDANAEAVSFFFRGFNDSTLVLRSNHFNGTTVGTMDRGGVYIEQSMGTGLLSGQIANNTFNNNNGTGLQIYQNGMSEICFDIRGNVSNNPMHDNYELQNHAGLFNVSPCNASDLNVGGLFDHFEGDIHLKTSCPSGSGCF